MGRLRTVAWAIVLLIASLAADMAAAAPAMWVVRDRDSEVYLFGTMHVLSPQAKWRTPAYDAAYARAETVWFEADLSSADRGLIVDLVSRYGVDRRRPLSAKLAPRDLAALRPLLARDRTPLEQIEHLRPWAAALALSIQPMLDGGARAESGADLTVTRQARAEVKAVRAFETLEDQVRMFAGLPEPVELQYLSDVIHRRARPARGRDGSLESAWIAGDIARLGDGLVREMRAGSPEFYEAFLLRRNLAWADTLTHEMARTRGVQLVNVGALHMVGRDGLPALMAARGFTVRRIQ